MNALAKDEVGKYLNRHFIAAYQRVGTFVVAANGQKQGGNVAGYFCTPDGLVVHAIAGPIDDAAFLREARWAVDACNLTMLKTFQHDAQLRGYFRKAHLERLQAEHGVSTYDPRYPGKNVPIRDWNALWTLNHRRVGANQGKVHLLLASSPLPRLGDIYEKVFVRILNEQISTRPVTVVGW